MTSDTARKLDMLKRIARFMQDHPSASSIPRAAAAHAEVSTIITALELAAQNQISGSSGAEGGVDLRASSAAALRAYLKDINRTARTLESDYPGISPTFRLPKTDSYPALIASARASIAAATPIQSSFIDAGLTPTFLTELSDLLTALQNATAQKHDGRITQVQSTAALKVKAALGMIAATKLDACIRNYYRTNPEMLAAWTHARHLERAPRRAQSETQPASSTATALTTSPDKASNLSPEVPPVSPSKTPSLPNGLPLSTGIERALADNTAGQMANDHPESHQATRPAESAPLKLTMPDRNS